MPTRQSRTVSLYRERMKQSGLVRCEVSVRREDVSLIRMAASALRDPKRSAVARATLAEHFGDPATPSFKELLASCPLDGIDLTRSRGVSRDVAL